MDSINKMLIVESENRNFSFNVDKLFEKYSQEYVDVLCVFVNDYDSLLLINLHDKNNNGTKGYIVNLYKTKPIISEYLKIIEEDNIKQLEICSSSGFVDRFLKEYNIDIAKNYIL